MYYMNLTSWMFLQCLCLSMVSSMKWLRIRSNGRTLQKLKKKKKKQEKLFKVHCSKLVFTKKMLQTSGLVGAIYQSNIIRVRACRTFQSKEPCLFERNEKIFYTWQLFYKFLLLFLLLRKRNPLKWKRKLPETWDCCQEATRRIPCLAGWDATPSWKTGPIEESLSWRKLQSKR